MLAQLNSWFEEFTPYSNEKEFVKSRFLIRELSEPEKYESDTVYKCQFYTRNHEYVILAHLNREGKRNRLSGGINNRLQRAGEDWVRGNDLADGDFNQETWNKIKNEIMHKEIVKISKTILNKEEIMPIVEKDIDIETS